MWTIPRIKLFGLLNDEKSLVNQFTNKMISHRYIMKILKNKHGWYNNERLENIYLIYIIIIFYNS